MMRWIECAGGILAAVVGVTIAAISLALGAFAWFVIVVGLAGIGAGIGAYLHSFGHGQVWLALLWVSSLGLVVMTFLAIFSVGIFLLPGTLAALIAAGLGTWRSMKGSIATQ